MGGLGLPRLAPGLGRSGLDLTSEFISRVFESGSGNYANQIALPKSGQSDFSKLFYGFPRITIK